jgi:phage gp36-like protein
MYCTQAQLETRYGTGTLVSLTNHEASTGLVVASVVEAAIADAAGEIDGYVGRRYQLPLTSTPDPLRDMCLVMAFYKLHRRETDEKTRRDYDDAMKRLKDVASGVFILNAAGVELAGSTSSSGGVETTGPERVLTGGSMEGFI